MTDEEIGNQLTGNPGRKDFSTQAKEGLQPDSQKSVFEKAKEGVTNAIDSVSGAAQPQQDKSAAQKAGDALTGHGDKS